jgi:hypothetical protein
VKRLALLALLAVAGCGSFTAGQPHTLSLAYRAGDTYRYRFHSSTKQTIKWSGQTLPSDIDITANEAVKVNSVDAFGTADVTITFSEYTLKSVAGGVTNTTSGLPANTTEIKIAADGTVVSVDGSQASAADPLAAFSGFGGGFFITAVLPDHPVKPGDTWSKTYDQAAPSPIPTGGTHIASQSTYLRDESLTGVKAAVVETKSSGTIDWSESLPASPETTALSVTGTFTTDVTSWIDPTGHRILKSHATAIDDGTIDLPNFHSDQTTPLLQGPITAAGNSTTDLAPA